MKEVYILSCPLSIFSINCFGIGNKQKINELFLFFLILDGTPIIGINDKSLTAKYQLLERKMRKLEEAFVCCICVERKKNVIFLCGHGTCRSCAEQLKTCPICQKPIEKKISTY